MKGKRIHGLDPSAPADKMIQLALRTQLKAMCKLREKALDPNDADGVHDMRVLSRRLRSHVSDFNPFLRKPGLSVVKLRALAKSLGAVRDQDVALAALKASKSDATGDAFEGIEMLEFERRTLREEALGALEKAIKPAAVDEVRDEFLARLGDVATVRPKKSARQGEGDSVLIFGQVASEVIAERLKEFRSAAAETIYRPVATKDLHELRILSKRLRYAIELFAPCWGKEMKEIAKEVSLMQTSLGELHDCDVWIEDLGNRLKRTTRKRKDDPDKTRERAAAVWLLRHFAKERTERYRAALARWEDWESQEFLNNLKSLVLEARP
jgi:CHAD domain-containing protein